MNVLPLAQTSLTWGLANLDLVYRAVWLAFWRKCGLTTRHWFFNWFFFNIIFKGCVWISTGSIMGPPCLRRNFVGVVFIEANPPLNLPWMKVAFGFKLSIDIFSLMHIIVFWIPSKCMRYRSPPIGTKGYWLAYIYSFISYLLLYVFLEKKNLVCLFSDRGSQCRFGQGVKRTTECQ